MWLLSAYSVIRVAQGLIDLTHFSVYFNANNEVEIFSGDLLCVDSLSKIAI
jgi:hypothetical protein